MDSYLEMAHGLSNDNKISPQLDPFPSFEVENMENKKLNLSFSSHRNGNPLLNTANRSTYKLARFEHTSRIDV